MLFDVRVNQVSNPTDGPLDIADLHLPEQKDNETKSALKVSCDLELGESKEKKRMLKLTTISKTDIQIVRTSTSTYHVQLIASHLVKNGILSH